MSASIADVLSLYASRYGNDIGFGERPALLVIDFSLAFTKGFGKFAGGFASELAETARLVDAARGRIPILFSTIAYQPDMRDAGLWAKKIPWISELQEGTEQVAINASLDHRPDEVFVKKYPSCFFGTGLDGRLKQQQIDSLIIAGCTTSTCVRATAVDAMQYGYRSVIAETAVGDFDISLHALHLADIRARYADVKPVDELIVTLNSHPRT